MRWKCLLNEYNLDLHHVKGKDNTAADYLSRIYGFSEAPIQGFNILQIYEYQLADQNYIKKHFKEELKVQKISIALNQERKIIIPPSQFESFFNYYHEYLGHAGTEKFINTFTDYIFTERFRFRVKELTKSCNYCQYCKVQHNTYGKST